jgi:hypothetical protein
MDDVDDKVRRNLVVFSGLVLAATWLGHPEVLPLSTLIKAETPTPTWRITTLAFVVLIYLVARYWFSQAHAAARHQMSIDWATNVSRVRDALILKTLKNHHRTKKQPTFIATNLEEYTRDEWASWGGENASDRELQFISVHIKPSDFWEGDISSTRRFVDGGKSGTAHGGNTLAFQFPLRSRARVSLKAAILQASFSRTAVEYFIPLVLAYLALLVLLYRLSRSLI